MKIIEARQYLPKRVVVEAIEWNGDDDMFTYLAAWSKGRIYREVRNVLLIAPPSYSPLNNMFEVRLNDYIVKDGDRLFVVKPDIFEKNYQLTSDELMRDGDMHNETKEV